MSGTVNLRSGRADRGAARCSWTFWRGTKEPGCVREYAGDQRNPGDGLAARTLLGILLGTLGNAGLTTRLAARLATCLTAVPTALFSKRGRMMKMNALMPAAPYSIPSTPRAIVTLWSAGAVMSNKINNQYKFQHCLQCIILL